MVDFELMIKALRLEWIPRLLKSGKLNWKTVPDFLFKKYGGLGFLLTCNYRMKDFEYLPRFYKDILQFFDELKYQYGSKGHQDMTIYKNKEILVGAKPFFFQEWFSKGIRTITDLLDNEGNVLSFLDFKSKYHLKKTNFLHFYQVISAIPHHLLVKAREMISSGNIPGEKDLTCFPLDESNTINLLRAKSKEFYRLLLHKTHTNPHSGPNRWERSISSDKIIWKEIFRSIRGTCHENKLREFHFEFIHRIIVTRKELFSDCIYCGEADSIDHSFLNCQFTMSFTQEVLQWFNATHNSTFKANTEEIFIWSPNCKQCNKEKTKF